MEKLTVFFQIDGKTNSLTVESNEADYINKTKIKSIIDDAILYWLEKNNLSGQDNIITNIEVKDKSKKLIAEQSNWKLGLDSIKLC